MSDTREVVQRRSWETNAGTWTRALNSWRDERFLGFAVRLPAKIAWFFRTMASWHVQLFAAELIITNLKEPLHPELGQPLSLLTCMRSAL